MENNEMFYGLPHDKEELKKAILEIADNLELEHLRMLYITAKIWENRFTKE